MKVVILAGGFGTRLSEETHAIPKPMIEIGGQPLLWHLMKMFAHQGQNEFVVALGYKGEIIKRYFLEYPTLHSNLTINLITGEINSHPKFSEKWQLELVDTGLNSFTGGRLRRLKQYLTETFILTYGDGLSNINIGKLLEFHYSHGKLATVTAVKPVSRFGLLKISEENQVKQFSEKPDCQNDLVNGGFFVLEPEVLDYIADDITAWEHEPCERLVANGQLMAYQHDGFWQCVDTLHELRQLRQIWETGQAEWKIWE